MSHKKITPVKERSNPIEQAEQTNSTKKKVGWTILIVLGSLALLTGLFFIGRAVFSSSQPEETKPQRPTEAYTQDYVGTWVVTGYLSAGQKIVPDEHSHVTIELKANGTLTHATMQHEDGDRYEPIVYYGTWEETENGFIERFDDGDDQYEYRKNGTDEMVGRANDDTVQILIYLHKVSP